MPSAIIRHMDSLQQHIAWSCLRLSVCWSVCRMDCHISWLAESTRNGVMAKYDLYVWRYVENCFIWFLLLMKIRGDPRRDGTRFKYVQRKHVWIDSCNTLRRIIITKLNRTECPCIHHIQQLVTYSLFAVVSVSISFLCCLRHFHINRKSNVERICLGCVNCIYTTDVFVAYTILCDTNTKWRTDKFKWKHLEGVALASPDALCASCVIRRACVFAVQSFGN